MKGFQKAFGVVAVAGVLVMTGSFAPKAVPAVLPVEHETRNALFVEHDRNALIVEHDRNALIVEHDRNALIVEHDRNALIVEHDRNA